MCNLSSPNIQSDTCPCIAQIFTDKSNFFDITFKPQLLSLPGPRNWHPLALMAAQRLVESWAGFWCWRISSVTERSPRERAALMARERPSSSTNWQLIKVTSFRCIGRLRKLFSWPIPEIATASCNKYILYFQKKIEPISRLIKNTKKINYTIQQLECLEVQIHTICERVNTNFI